MSESLEFTASGLVGPTWAYLAKEQIIRFLLLLAYSALPRAYLAIQTHLLKAAELKTNLYKRNENPSFPLFQGLFKIKYKILLSYGHLWH